MRYTIIFLFTILLLSGCLRPYKVDIQQGNIINAEQLEQLKPGMTRREVQYILGTPLVEDPFHADRWDYFYSLKEGREKNRQQQLITVVFRTDALADIEGVPETRDVREKKPELISPDDKKKKQGFFKRVFSKDSES
ncbi:MAG: outer membrane protein assembly factor BamE [Gammaproteobacteria bacterium]|nr:outer membrane protein assembly factor BamE [Gammaproteobacteria bacterium]